VIKLEKVPGSDGRRRLNLTLDGGTADLFKFNTGAPFVGADAQSNSFQIRAPQTSKVGSR
jgi:hypothetical protein